MTRTSLALAAALLVVAVPAVAQTTSRQALAMRPAPAQRAMIDEVLRVNTGEDRSTVIGLWGYALSDSALLYCGTRTDNDVRKTGFAVVLNGVDRDTVVVNMSVASLREVGCGRPGYTALSATAPGDNPLAGVVLDMTRPDPSPARHQVFAFPYAQAREPDCMAGRALAYEGVVLGNTSAASAFPREMLAADSGLFGLCYNASGQEFVNERLGEIVAEADVRNAALRTRAFLNEATLYLNRLRYR